MNQDAPDAPAELAAEALAAIAGGVGSRLDPNG
jgi:hypothetical protein